jgi:hypothetical protein
MAVDDHPPQVASGVQERLPDPEQVVRRLLIEREARVDAGVYEQVVAALEAQLETLEEIDVGARDPVTKMLLQLLIVTQIVL